MPPRTRSSRIWPLTGRTGGPAPTGASAGLQAPAATTTAPHSTTPAEVRTPVTRPRSCSIASTSTPSSSSLDDRGERAHRGARVRLAVAVGQDGAGDPRREARLERAARGWASATPRRARASAAARAGGAAPRRRRGRPRPRARRLAVAGRQPAALLQLRGERRASARARSGSRAAAAPRRSPPRSPARAFRRPRARRRRRARRRARAPARTARADSRAKRWRGRSARTDHDGVVACAPRQLNLLPFAGITRVRFDGRRRRSRPLSPVPPSSRWLDNRICYP